MFHHLTDSDLCDPCNDVSDMSYISDLDDNDLSDGSPINNDNFNIVHYNVNSITAEGRLDQLSDICSTLNLDVLIVTESKLDQTIPINLITIPGYHEPIRRDRNINGRCGGGVLIYISDNLIFQQRNNLQSDNYEHIWVDVKIRNIYRKSRHVFRNS